MSVTRIRVKERDAIIQSLKSGVTPRIGIQHIQVGRVNEITALHQDIERIADGGASFRLIIGEYGSGKTFFLSVVRSIALEKKLVSVSADLSPDRRIHSSGVKWFTEFGHLNRGDMLTSEQHRCHNEKKKFQRRV
ncbi:hypothetical protein AE00_04773 [Klebsiella pneumoniae MGH 74]|nr:hypothetical protein AE00_04773 [Klebsiella pneumoniae MGH 74]